MSWEGQAQITHEEILATAGSSSEEYLALIKQRGIPISPDYLVDMELIKDDGRVTYYYRWKKKPDIPD